MQGFQEWLEAQGEGMRRSDRREHGSLPRYRWYIFWVLALQFMFVYFHRVSSAVVAPELIKTFNISGTALGVLSAGYFYMYALMQVPAGLLSDAWGPRKTVTVFTFIAGLGAILFGLSPGFGMATCSRILVGLGLSTTFVSSMKIFSSWFHAREYARVSGIFLGVGGMGWLIASTPLAVLSQWYGWRPVFVVIGVVSLFLGALTWFVVIDRPGERQSKGRIKYPRPEKGRRIGNDIKQVLGERYFWPLAVWSFINGAILFGFFGLWAGPYLIEVRGLSKANAGNILSMVALSMIVGSPAVGYIADRLVPSRKLLLLLSSIIQACCWMIMLFYHTSISYGLLYVFFFVMGLTSIGTTVVLLTATKELYPAEIAGTSQGIMNLFPFVASVVFQPLIGFVLDKTKAVAGVHRYEGAFQLLAAVSIVAVISLLFMKNDLKIHDGRSS